MIILLRITYKYLNRIQYDLSNEIVMFFFYILYADYNLIIKTLLEQCLKYIIATNKILKNINFLKNFSFFLLETSFNVIEYVTKYFICFFVGLSFCMCVCTHISQERLNTFKNILLLYLDKLLLKFNVCFIEIRSQTKNCLYISIYQFKKLLL